MTSTLPTSAATTSCILSDVQLAALRRCDKGRMAFALFALPGEDYASFLADPEPVSEAPAEGRFVSITVADESIWDTAESIFIRDIMSATDVVRAESLPRPAPSLADVTPAPTPAVSYLAQVHEIAAHLKPHGEKAVLARRITGSTASPIDEIATRLFDGTSPSMRFIYYTPDTGLWLGATPELLLSSVIHPDGRSDIRTMALAGTYPADSDELWDPKNLEEQKIVDLYIRRALLKADAGSLTFIHSEKTHGAVKHLCTEYTATLPAGSDPLTLEKDLHPTPAVLGHPLEKAYLLLRRYETIERRCYSGLFSVNDINPQRHLRDTYVMLRCAMLGTQDTGVRGYNIYVGAVSSTHHPL